MDQQTVQSPAVEGGAALLTLRKATGGDLALAVMKLFKSTFVPTPANVAADFAAQEAAFTGYAASPGLVWSAVIYDSTGAPVVTSSALYTQTGVVAIDSVGGFWLETAAGKVIQFGIFPQPAQMNAVGRFLNITAYVNGVGDSYADVQS